MGALEKLNKTTKYCHKKNNLMIIFFKFFIHSISIQCNQSYEWQYYCIEPNISDIQWKKENCHEQNIWHQQCEVYDTINCEGNRTFIRKKWCPNANGLKYNTAVLLSFFLGVFGIDRFYLGYTSVGFMKFFTGGFFLIGYLTDCILITCQIVRPVGGYAASKPFPLLTGSPHRDIF